MFSMVLGVCASVATLCIEVDTSNHQAQIYDRGAPITESFCVGTAREGYQTPLGDFKAIALVAPDAFWIHPEYPDIVVSSDSSYYPAHSSFVFHEDDRGWQFGIHAHENHCGFVSMGCVRFPPLLAAWLYQEIDSITEVRIR